MLSDPARTRIDWSRRTEPSELAEWMDESDDPSELRACLRDLYRVNTVTRGFHPTLTFLEQLLRREEPASPLRILDIGSGGGDMLGRIARWAHRRGLEVQLTGIDLNPIAASVAMERYGDTDIQWLTGDALRYRGEADVVISCLLTHHLDTGDVVRLVRWMEQTAARGWFINDLERSARSARGFSLLAKIMRWHRFVQHDGPVSFARSFLSDDWQRILAEAAVPAGAAELSQHFPGRLCVGRSK